MLKLDGQFATGIQPNDLVAGDFGGDGQVVLVGVQASSLTGDWIFGA